MRALARRVRRRPGPMEGPSWLWGCRLPRAAGVRLTAGCPSRRCRCGCAPGRAHALARQVRQREPACGTYLVAGVLVDDRVGDAVGSARRACGSARGRSRRHAPRARWRRARPGCRGCRRRCYTDRQARPRAEQLGHERLGALREVVASMGGSCCRCGCSAAITAEAEQPLGMVAQREAAEHDADAPRARPTNGRAASPRCGQRRRCRSDEVMRFDEARPTRA